MNALNLLIYSIRAIRFPSGKSGLHLVSLTLPDADDRDGFLYSVRPRQGCKLKSFHFFFSIKSISFAEIMLELTIRHWRSSYYYAWSQIISPPYICSSWQLEEFKPTVRKFVSHVESTTKLDRGLGDDNMPTVTYLFCRIRKLRHKQAYSCNE